MTRVLVADLAGRIGETVKVAGWVNTLRLQRAMQFVLVRDHTGVVQVTSRRDGGELEALLDGLTTESAVIVTGQVVANPIVALGGLEIIPATVEVAAVQTTAEQAMREFAYARGCTELHTPKPMGTASESGAEVFRLGYFGRSAYLAQSPQFYKQMAIAAGLDRVFEIGPVFRAEPSFTSRHATEFTGVDVELAWIDGVEEVMAFEELMLVHVAAAVAERHGVQIREQLGVEVTVPTLPFPRITMAQAQRVLGSGPSRDDLDPEGERRLGAHFEATAGHEFVFVTDYPASVRPFYHMRPDGQQTVTCSFDLLWKGLEITTGAQREHRYEVLLRQAAEKGLDPEPISDYLNCFRYGCPPHGGFGLGLGRVLMAMLGLESIRDATFLFRGPNRLSP
jgi:aspartyl/asparaginyl-tRNA synthetase